MYVGVNGKMRIFGLGNWSTVFRNICNDKFDMGNNSFDHVVNWGKGFLKFGGFCVSLQ